MPIPETVSRLVQKFKEHRDHYRDPSYKEARLRVEFLDDFFEALGWDISNREGYSEAYKDVVVEDSLIVEGSSKAPDYTFRIGGQPKFYAEAKKPSRNLKDDPEPALQLRRYAWTAGMSLSIVTDFEELAVYDTRIPPKPDDPAHVARTLYFTLDEYAHRWDELASLFSKEAILRGGFDKYAVTTKTKRGTAQVDDAILQQIEGWREDLAKDVAANNVGLDRRDLNFVVQQTIDRILFLRISEDRGIERYGTVQEASKGAGVYGRLVNLFKNADNKYNSGLFHFRPEKGRAEPPDTLSTSVTINDKPLRDLISEIYWPKSPYIFKALPADILGQVYEQFLGKTIVLDSKHRATVEEKPEVRKAGGVYYTPTYVVSHIVHQALSPLIMGKTPTQLSGLRILDPACGSGSFLIQAYQFLLDWHLDWYHKNDPDKLARKKSPPIYQASDGQWRLTTSERKRILLNNIYGVDIDLQAVEVTKLSLLLRVLEGESAQSLAPQLTFMADRALPDLANNVKCGNSLIESDFMTPLQMSMLDDEARQRVNVFDWRKEFRDITKAGGFDVVIGNPPYVLLQDEFRDDAQLEYFKAKYAVAAYKLDTYHLFIEQGIHLTKDGGRFSMITPSNFITNNHLVSLRRFLLEHGDIEELMVVDRGVFEGISVDNAIFAVRVGKPKAKTFSIVHVQPASGAFIPLSNRTISVKNSLNDPHVLFTGAHDKTLLGVWSKILKDSAPLGEIAYVNFGKQLRDRREFKRDVIEVARLADVPKGYRPCYTGKDVGRYFVQWNGLACMTSTVAQRGGCWDPERQDTTNKILTRQIGRYPEFGLDELGYQCLNTMFMINLDSEDYSPDFVLGVLNSKLIRAVWLNKFYDQRRTFPKIKGTYLKHLPILRRDDGGARRTIADLARKVIDLTKKLPSARTNDEKARVARLIDVTETGIDRELYRAYKLSAAEVEAIEAIV